MTLRGLQSDINIISNLIICWGKSQTVNLAANAHTDKTASYATSFTATQIGTYSIWSGSNNDICQVSFSATECMFRFANTSNSANHQMTGSYIVVGY